MQKTTISYFLVLWLFSAGIAFAVEDSRSITVQNSFDNRPFTYLEKPLAQRPGYSIFRLKYPSPMVTPVEQNNTVPADYYLPDGIKPGDPKRPAVICLHILDGNDALTDMVCSVLASRGIPAIMFRLPYYGERSLPEGPMAMAKDPKLLAGAIEQAVVDVRRTFDLLASRPEIDPQKIGISGISLGGIVAASAAGSEPRLHRAALLLAGGDLMSIIHHAQETKPLSQMLEAMPAADRLELESKIAAVDPLKFASGLRERAQNGQVLMINAVEDEVIPKKNTEKLADALAIPDKIVWLDGLGHYTALAELPQAMKTMTSFFARDLPPGVVPPSASLRKRELIKLAGFFRQTATLLAEKPEPGKCFVIALEYSMMPRNQKNIDGRLRFVRDSGNRFALSCKLPVLGEIALGQGDYPWIVSNGVVLAGTEKPEPILKNPRDLLGKQPLTLFRSAAGLLNSLALTPEVLLRFIEVAEDSPTVENQSLLLSGKNPSLGCLHLQFRGVEDVPSDAKYESAGGIGNARFLDWNTQAEARAELFDPPADLPVKNTNQSDVYQRFDILRNLARMASQ